MAKSMPMEEKKEMPKGGKKKKMAKGGKGKPKAAKATY